MFLKGFFKGFQREKSVSLFYLGFVPKSSLMFSIGIIPCLDIDLRVYRYY